MERVPASYLRIALATIVALCCACAGARSSRTSAALPLTETGVTTASRTVAWTPVRSIAAPASVEERAVLGAAPSPWTAAVRQPRTGGPGAELGEAVLALDLDRMSAAFGELAPPAALSEWRFEMLVVDEEDAPVEGQSLEPRPGPEPDLMRVSWLLDLGAGTSLACSIAASRELDVQLPDALLDPDYVWIGFGLEHRF